MNDFLHFVYDWMAYIIFTIISLYRIIRWLIPDRKWGDFLGYAPYSKEQKYLVIITAAVFIIYFFISAFDTSHAISTRVIRFILVASWVLTISLPNKKYKYGTLTPFGFKSNRNQPTR